jgi:hypothetical protein
MEGKEWTVKELIEALKTVPVRREKAYYEIGPKTIIINLVAASSHGLAPSGLPKQ